MLDVGQAPLVVQMLVEPVRLAEKPLGVDQRAAEHFDETAHPQRTRQSGGVFGIAQQVDRLAQLESGIVDTTGNLAERTP